MSKSRPESKVAEKILLILQDGAANKAQIAQLLGHKKGENLTREEQ